MNMNQSIFKAYDIRGIYPTEVNTEVARNVAKAALDVFSEENSNGEIIVAHDVRYGSPELAATVVETLEAEVKAKHKTFSTRLVGMSSTPMFYFLVNHFKAVGGIMITASHNPKNYNGMKIVQKGAEMIPGVDILKVITQHNIA
jgi:phosphomannomutase